MSLNLNAENRFFPSQNKRKNTLRYTIIILVSLTVTTLYQVDIR